MKQRHQAIIDLIEQIGYLSVNELSERYQVSEVTIRRDLQTLEDSGHIKRTHGGAVPVETGMNSIGTAQSEPPTDFLLDGLDAVVASSVTPEMDRLLLEQARLRGIPVISESSRIDGATTLVTVDSEAAAYELGEWTATYLAAQGITQANVLDLTYRLNNSRQRSGSFLQGLQANFDTVQIMLSVDAQSKRAMAQQLTQDALRVYPAINVIFAVDAATGAGAIDACEALMLPPGQVMVVTFGLQGDQLREKLLAGTYVKAGVAVFPEIFAPICIQAAARAAVGDTLPDVIATPHKILTSDNLHTIYRQENSRYVLNYEQARAAMTLPLDIDQPVQAANNEDAITVGMVIPFQEHVWYRNLQIFMAEYAQSQGIHLKLMDTDQQLRDALRMRQQQIAERAATLIEPNDMVLIGDGDIGRLLAVALTAYEDVTVVTHSLAVFDSLRDAPGVELILTGGHFLRQANRLDGRMTEQMLLGLRVDKLFLEVDAISMAFGLSDAAQQAVALKQIMLRSAHHVVLLALHTHFDTEATVQIAPLDAVDIVVTDNGLPASHRLLLSGLGKQVIVVGPQYDVEDVK